MRAIPSLRTTVARPRGFTFLEILVVMSIAAVLLGLGIGFLVNVGKASLAEQAAEIVAESGRRVLNSSAGGKRATLELRAVDVEGTSRLEVQTSVQRTVLTANFEGDDWFINANEPSTAKISGAAHVDTKGGSGCAVLASGATVDYGTRSAFAMTDGVEVALKVRPDAAGRRMIVVRADADATVVWQVELVAATGRVAAFDVEFLVKDVPADAPEAMPGAGRTYRTAGGVVPAGAWTDLRVVYDGRDCSIQVGGVERLPPEKAKSAVGGGRRASRLWVPPGGTARLSTGPTFVGAIDTLTVSGIFRSDEDVRRLALGVEPFRMSLPVRIVFLNGRLDPLVHKADVEVRLKGPGDSESTGFMSLRFGLYGSLSSPVYRPGEVAK